MLSPETHFLVPMCLVSKMVAPGKTCSLIFVIDVSSDSQDCTALPALECCCSLSGCLLCKGIRTCWAMKNTGHIQFPCNKMKKPAASFNSRAKTFWILCQQNAVAFPKLVFWLPVPAVASIHSFRRQMGKMGQCFLVPSQVFCHPCRKKCSP